MDRKRAVADRAVGIDGGSGISMAGGMAQPQSVSTIGHEFQ